MHAYVPGGGVEGISPKLNYPVHLYGPRGGIEEGSPPRRGRTAAAAHPTQSGYGEIYNPNGRVPMRRELEITLHKLHALNPG